MKHKPKKYMKDLWKRNKAKRDASVPKVVREKMKRETFFYRCIRPFWFSKDKEVIQVPYFYGSVIMIIIVALVIHFMVIADKKSAGVLAVYAGVITTMSGLYAGVIKLYIRDNIIIREEKDD